MVSSGTELLYGTTVDLLQLGLETSSEDADFDEVDAELLVQQILWALGPRLSPRRRRIIAAILAGCAPAAIAAAEGVCRETVRAAVVEFRGELRSQALNLFDGYLLLRGAAQRCRPLQPPSVRPVHRRRREADRRRADDLAAARADAARYALEGRLIPIGLIGEPVIWVRPGLPPRTATIRECHGRHLVIELDGDGRRATVFRPRLRATPQVKTSSLAWENILPDSGMTADELVAFRGLASSFTAG